MNRRLTGVILAGGSATRMNGVAKGLLEVGGCRIIDRVAAALAPVVDDMVLASRTTGNAWLAGIREVADLLTGGGSAAGVHAALRATRGPVLVVGWDMPFLNSSLLSLVIARSANGADGSSDEVDMVVPAGVGDGDLEPLCAWYAPSCAAAIERGWDTHDRSLHGLCNRLRARIVTRREVLSIGEPRRLFFNVNTSADLDAARAMADDDT